MPIPGLIDRLRVPTLSTEGDVDPNELPDLKVAGTVATTEPGDVVVAVHPPSKDAPESGTSTMMLRDWNVTHSYASYYIEPIDDLDGAAEALVRAGVASSVYVADGMAYWLGKGGVTKQRPDLGWREHEAHAKFTFPEGIEGWAKYGLYRALLQRFSEKKAFSPLPGPQHEYLRAALEPLNLRFDEGDVILIPSLKLYKEGVFSISYDIQAAGDAISIPDFVSRYVNLFARWCDNVWVPHAVAKLGLASQLYREAEDSSARAVNLELFKLMSSAADSTSQMIGVDGLTFRMCAAHKNIDDIVTSVLQEMKDDPRFRDLIERSAAQPPDAGSKAQVAISDKLPESGAQADAARGGDVEAAATSALGQTGVEAPATEPPAADSVETTSGSAPHQGLQDSTAKTADTSERATVQSKEESSNSDAAITAQDTNEAGPVKDEQATQSYLLSDMFDNTEFAVRVALDPLPEAEVYIRHGLNPQLTRGDFWYNRPQVSINTFDDQPTSASEIREQFGDQLGLIMMRVRGAPQKAARAQLGESLRPFEDYSLHLNQSLTLCVYAAERRYRVEPPVLEVMDRACVCEAVDYLAMRCHQLDERASRVRSVAQAREVRADLSATENRARTLFRASELTSAVTTAWQRLELSDTVKEAREKVSLAAEVASERAAEQGARFNAMLAVVFGLVGASGLTDSLTKPLWTRLGLPLPQGLEGPVCFFISAAFVGLVLWCVTRRLKRE